jgi:hypothetical protein
VKRSGDQKLQKGPSKRIAGRGLDDDLFEIPGVLKDNDLRYPFKVRHSEIGWCDVNVLNVVWL